MKKYHSGEDPLLMVFIIPFPLVLYSRFSGILGELFV